MSDDGFPFFLFLILIVILALLNLVGCTDQLGKQVNGVVCSGLLFKNATIRF